MGILKTKSDQPYFRAKKSVSFKFETETQPERKETLEYSKHTFSKKFLARVHQYVLNSFSNNEHDKLAKTFNNFKNSPFRVKYLHEYGYKLFRNTIIYHENNNNLKLTVKIIDKESIKSFLLKDNHKILEKFLSLTMYEEDEKEFNKHTRSQRIEKLEILFSIDQQTVAKYIFGNEVFSELSAILQEDIKIALNKVRHKSVLTQASNSENISPNINSGNQQKPNMRQYCLDE